MDPYYYENTHDEDGIINLKEIIDFARNNKNVSLLVGNHDCSYIWSFHRIERTAYEFYHELHNLYRENIELFKPCLKIDDVLFTHGGVSNGWITSMNNSFASQGSNFRLTQDNITSYIGNEFQKELMFDRCEVHIFYSWMRSPIFNIGYARGGDSPYGGPFWSDFNDEFWNPNK